MSLVAPGTHGLSLAKLPPGWRLATLGDACEFLDARRIPVNQTERLRRIEGKSESDLYPYYGATGQTGWIDDYLFDEPLILLAEDGADFGSRSRPIAYAVTGRYWVNNHAHVLRPKPGVDFAFLLYALMIRPDVGHLVSGSTRAKLNQAVAKRITVPLPPLAEQKQIAAALREQLDAAARMRAAADSLTRLLDDMIDANLRRSLAGSGAREVQLAECLVEVKNGVGVRWREYPVLGVTRRGVASAKESVGKFPERYKLVDSGTVFYNPMRILLGSIGMVDAEDATGITSPDYVVVKAVDGKLHHRWFYWWLRSWRGAEFIKSLTRGAVRERMLFRRLASGSVRLPPWESQVEAAGAMLRIAEARRQVAAQSPSIDALPIAFLRRAFGAAD